MWATQEALSVDEDVDDSFPLDFDLDAAPVLDTCALDKTLAPVDRKLGFTLCCCLLFAWMLCCLVIRLTDNVQL